MTISYETAEAAGRHSPRVFSHARAYGGDAHGRCWKIGGPPPHVVEVEVEDRRVHYLLVHHPRTRRPATDHLGNYLYVPALAGPSDNGSGTDREPEGPPAGERR